MKSKFAKLKKSPASETPTAERVWMVYGDCGRTPPKHLHYSEKSAREEARRLAQANIGSRFFVMRAVACFCAQKPEPVAYQIVAADPSTQTLGDDIPF